MIRWRKANPQWLAGALGILAVLAASAFAGRVAAADDDKPWVAPEDARQVKNPVPDQDAEIRCLAGGFSQSLKRVLGRVTNVRSLQRGVTKCENGRPGSY